MSAHHHHSRKRSSSRNKPKKEGPRREHIQELHPSEDVPDISSFDAWELNQDVLRAIRNMDITKPTPIQALAIGPALAGKDVIAKAETGTGKTLAFGAPMMSNMDVARSTVLGLVLCPTRELAQQVADVLKALGLPRGLQVALVVGGDPMQPQIAQLHAGAQVVVGTPGRVLDLYQQRFLSFPWTEVVVLDEADKMFEIGFLDDIKKILSFLPDERQTLLFSATFPTEVLKLARESTTNPVELATQRGPATVDSIDQFHIKLDSEDRPMVLTRLMEQSGEKDVFLVFCERRTDVDRLLRRMERLRFEIKALHGGYDQPSRFRVMSAYRTGEVKALLATDVAARGLDVSHVTHVINFGVPRELEDYTHRIGRTGRAGRSGTAITFVPPEDARRWHSLIAAATWEIPEMEAPGRYKQAETRSRSERPTREREGREERPVRDERPVPDERPRREERPVRDELPRRDERQDREQRIEAPAPRRTESDRGERHEQRSSQEDKRARRITPTAGAPLSRWARASDDEVARRKAERASERGVLKPRTNPRDERQTDSRPERPTSDRARSNREREPQREERPRSSERNQPERESRSERPARDRDRPDREREPQREERPRSPERNQPERESRSERPARDRDRSGRERDTQREERPRRPERDQPAPQKPAPKPTSKPIPPSSPGPSFGTGI